MAQELALLYAHAWICKPQPVQRNQLRPGDHIFYHTKGGTIQHHGVVVEGGMVIHLSKAGAVTGLKFYRTDCEHECEHSTSCVRMSHVDCFAKHERGRKIYLVLYGQTLRTVMTFEVGSASTQLRGPANDIVARAHAALRSQRAYHPVYNNCETGARGWVVGPDCYRYSKQSVVAVAILLFS